MKSSTEANLRKAEIAREIKRLELESSEIDLAQAELASLDGHDEWLTIASSVAIFADITGEAVTPSPRQKVRRLAEQGKVSARRQDRRDGSGPGKKWVVNKLSLILFLERAYKNGITDYASE